MNFTSGISLFSILAFTILSNYSFAETTTYGDIVQETITVISAATNQPIPGAAVRVSTTKNMVFPGGQGFAGADGVFGSSFNNTNDSSGTVLEDQEVYTYGYGYNIYDGQYEYFLGYFDEEVLVPYEDFTSGYIVAAAAVGYDYTPVNMKANLGHSPTLLVGTVALPLTYPPAYAEPFLERLYSILFNSAVDPGGLAGWSDQLRYKTKAVVAEAILRSPERSDFLINDFYFQYLGRYPNLANKTDLTNVLAYQKILEGRGTQEQFLTQLLSGNEYYNLKIHTAPSYLKGLYLDLLGRWPTAAETKAATGSRSDIVARVLASEDYQMAMINIFYQVYLGRPADAIAYTSWYTNGFQKKLNSYEVQAGIIASDEFTNQPFPIVRH